MPSVKGLEDYLEELECHRLMAETHSTSLKGTQAVKGQAFGETSVTCGDLGIQVCGQSATVTLAAKEYSLCYMPGKQTPKDVLHDRQSDGSFRRGQSVT
ncbi:hypothetical protein NQZ68_028236 [Dissostichus eleginoides]|nr:hypothetical protein NQZ68_028236 [Dissostichus eleginoides]